MGTMSIRRLGRRIEWGGPRTLPIHSPGDSGALIDFSEAISAPSGIFTTTSCGGNPKTTTFGPSFASLGKRRKLLGRVNRSRRPDFVQHSMWLWKPRRRLLIPHGLWKTRRRLSNRPGEA